MWQIISTIIFGVGGEDLFFQKQAFEHHSLNGQQKQFTCRKATGYKFWGKKWAQWSDMAAIMWPIVPASPYGGGGCGGEESLIPATTQDPTPPYLIVLERPVNERPWRPALAGSLLWWHCVHICRDCTQEVLLSPVNHLRVTVGENCKEMLSWLLDSFPSFFSTGGKKICSGY